MMATSTSTTGDDVQEYDWPSRTYTHTVAGVVVETRALTPDEEAWVGPLAASIAAAAAADQFRRDLVGGLAALAAAQALAVSDQPVATAAIAAATADQAAALSLKALADALAAKPLPTLADIKTLAAGVSLLCQYRADADGAFVALHQWRLAVDQNAVLTDQSLTFLGQLVQSSLPTQ